ncbi:helix-turn-helix domain-containing protein [Halobacteriaceae archaeon GCM10025711]
MEAGIRAEMEVGAPGGCTVAEVSERTGTAIDSVTRAVVANRDGTYTEEFTLSNDIASNDVGLSESLQFDSHSVYRFDRDPTGDCVCAAIEECGCPVSDVRAENGSLFVSFYAPDMDTVKHIFETLSGTFDGVSVRQLTGSDDHTETDFAVVDRNILTDRQREVLETAYRMGYFAHPKGANKGDVAEALGIAPSTMSEHLAAAQTKLFEAIVDG